MSFHGILLWTIAFSIGLGDYHSYITVCKRPQLFLLFTLPLCRLWPQPLLCKQNAFIAAVCQLAGGAATQCSSGVSRLKVELPLPPGLLPQTTETTGLLLFDESHKMLCVFTVSKWHSGRKSLLSSAHDFYYNFLIFYWMPVTYGFHGRVVGVSRL